MCHSTDLANALPSHFPAGQPPFFLPPSLYPCLSSFCPSACVVLCVAYSISYIRLLPAWQLSQLPPPPLSPPAPLEDNSLCNCVSYGICVRCVCLCVCLLNNFQLSASHVILQNNFQTAFAAAAAEAAAKFTAQLWVSCVASHAPLTHTPPPTLRPLTAREPWLLNTKWTRVQIKFCVCKTENRKRRAN